MTDSSKYRFIEEALQERRRKHRFRELRPFEPKSSTTLEGDKGSYINFSGNDYLGLSKHPEVKRRAAEYAEKYGAGSTASRLINGTYRIHEELENRIAGVFGRESALLFNSGFQANSTIIGTLADRHSLILADKLSHNSLLQGALGSRATLRRFSHNSLEDLESQLQKASDESHSRIFVVTESLFSMDGDRSDLEAISELCETYEAWLFVDDAHAVGVWGDKGLGLSRGVSGIDMVLGTCGKAFGGFGAFLLCSSRLRDYLVNFCPGFIYTTSLPPSVVGGIEASLELIPDMDSARKRLHENIIGMRKGIQAAGFETGDSDSQIIPIMVGGEQETLELSGQLEEAGFLATAIRPPTVPEGSARIRITLSSEHTKEQISKFLNALNRWQNNG